MIFPFIFIRTFIKKMNWIFYNHVNKKGYFSNHENIISYDITTISKIVHPSLSKDMKGPVQIKRGKFYSLSINLPKNQLYKHKNQINKVPTICKQDDIELFSKYICTRHFTNVDNLLSCYHNGRTVICRYQGVTLRNNNKLF